jgi:hypothetical protein
MDWNNSHKNPPEPGQKVYYFGPEIGIGIGHYKYEEHVIKSRKGNKDIELCPHVFTNVNWGVVDACDAPYWLPYDEEQAKSWVPIVPKEYTKNLYDE